MITGSRRARIGDRATAAAPVRVADVGGWTDTWFGAPGQVCSVAVGPAVHVDAALVEAGRIGSGTVSLCAPDLGVAYEVVPAPTWADPGPGAHPLLEHAVGEVLARSGLPDGAAVEVTVRSAVPPGASLGTSAAVVVALLGALDVLLLGDGGQGDRTALARRAHAVETERAGRQAGVQDQWAAAHGGIGVMAVAPYPDVRHRPVPVAAPVVDELDARLVTVVFGEHDSSAVHAEVITALTSCSGATHDAARAAMATLARLAGEAAHALGVGDLDAWGQTLVAATEAQASLHPGLVGDAHRHAIEVARSQMASGWKVNGAGGEGGSMTMVARSRDRRDDLAAALADAVPAWQVLDLTVAPGLAVSLGR